MVVTENLYMAAYAITHGGKLKRIIVSHANANGRNTAIFEIDSPWADKLADEYLGGAGVVNALAFRQNLEELKDQLFAALKKTETKRGSHGFARQG